MKLLLIFSLLLFSFVYSARADWPSNSCDICQLRSQQFKYNIASMSTTAASIEDCENLCDKKVSVFRPKESTECLFKGSVIGTYPAKHKNDPKETELSTKFNCGLWGKTPVLKAELHSLARTEKDCLDFCDQATLTDEAQAKRNLRCLFNGKEILKYDDKTLWRQSCRLVEAGGAPVKVFSEDKEKSCDEACGKWVEDQHENLPSCKIEYKCMLGDKLIRNLTAGP